MGQVRGLMFLSEHRLSRRAGGFTHSVVAQCPCWSKSTEDALAMGPLRTPRRSSAVRTSFLTLIPFVWVSITIPRPTLAHLLSLDVPCFQFPQGKTGVASPTSARKRDTTSSVWTKLLGT